MEPISSFFSKFINLNPPEREIRKALVRAIRDTLGVEIDEASVVVRECVAHLKVPSIIKSELFLRKAELIAAANKSLSPEKAPLRDIR